MLKRLHFETREDWLKGREAIRGIGGSDAAAAAGFSKRKTPVDLWREKTGRAKAKDLSGINYVELGRKTETPMRELFAALHPEYEIKHFPFDILYQSERPWLFATLDGEMTEIETGERGVLEIKKFEIQTRADWNEWNGKIPRDYFCQVLHQMAATGWSYAWLYALLLKRDGDGELRQYYFPRYAYGEDLASLIGGEEKFMRCVESGRVPPAPLTV